MELPLDKLTDNTSIIFELNIGTYENSICNLQKDGDKYHLEIFKPLCIKSVNTIKCTKDELVDYLNKNDLLKFSVKVLKYLPQHGGI